MRGTAFLFCFDVAWTIKVSGGRSACPLRTGNRFLLDDHQPDRMPNPRDFQPVQKDFVR
jgi:hypothetical protein